jgi:hypothetical protein
MKKLKQQFVFITGCCFFYTSSLSSQNLVLNGSMEVYANCPTWPETSYVAPWGGYNTPDYFNLCSNLASPVNNIFGWQIPFNGSAFIGAANYYVTIPEGREFITNSLSQPLISGSEYCVKYYLSLGDSVTVGIDSHGMLISDSLLTQYPLQGY